MSKITCSISPFFLSVKIRCLNWMHYFICISLSHQANPINVIQYVYKGSLISEGILKKTSKAIMSAAEKIEPNIICPCVFTMIFWQILIKYCKYVSHVKTIKMRCTRCLYNKFAISNKNLEKNHRKHRTCCIWFDFFCIRLYLDKDLDIASNERSPILNFFHFRLKSWE